MADGLVVRPGDDGHLVDADLLVVEGNPLADLAVLMKPQKNLKLIMKDGAVYKNELAA